MFRRDKLKIFIYAVLFLVLVVVSIGSILLFVFVNSLDIFETVTPCMGDDTISKVEQITKLDIPDSAQNIQVFSEGSFRECAIYVRFQAEALDIQGFENIFVGQVTSHIPSYFKYPSSFLNWQIKEATYFSGFTNIGVADDGGVYVLIDRETLMVYMIIFV